MSLKWNRMFDRHLPSVNKIYTYNIMKENKSFYQTRIANQYRDAGNISRVMDFLVRGRQLQYSSAQQILGRLHERKDKVQYNVQQETFEGGTPCGSVKLIMDGLGKIKKISASDEFSKLPFKYRRDFYVSAYFQALQQARSKLYADHVNINNLAMNELHDALSEFETIRDEQRRNLGVIPKGEAIEKQKALLLHDIDLLTDQQFEKHYGKTKEQLNPENIPDHVLLAMYEKTRYLKTNIPITPIELSIGKTEDPLMVEATLFKRAFKEPELLVDEDAQDDSESIKLLGEDDGDISFSSTEKELLARKYYAEPKQISEQMFRDNLLSYASPIEKALKEEEINAMLGLDTYLNDQRKTIYQLFGSLSDDRVAGMDDPTLGVITVSDVAVEAVDETTTDEDVRRNSNPADYDISLANVRDL